MRDGCTFAESLMRLLRRLRYPFCFNADQLLTLRTNNRRVTCVLKHFNATADPDSGAPREVNIATTVVVFGTTTIIIYTYLYLLGTYDAYNCSRNS